MAYIKFGEEHIQAALGMRNDPQKKEPDAQPRQADRTKSGPAARNVSVLEDVDIVDMLEARTRRPCFLQLLHPRLAA